MQHPTRYHEGEPYPDDVIEYMARLIAVRLLRDVTGDIRRPTAWRRLARGMGIAVQEYHLPGRARGQCMPGLLDETGVVSGAVGVNTAYLKPDQAAVWVHELAHLYLFTWMPPFLRRSAPGERCYEGDSDSDSHEIARRVEHIVLGVAA